ncbi:MAG TPA: hypothetical protein VFT13_12850, partial [Candidatus Krumholzibacteria bacterium]|nr:hypothetical protein [Candidatus Krumholzibacteria bacterium]
MKRGTARMAGLATALILAGAAAPAPAQRAFPDTLGAWTLTHDGGAFDAVPRAEYLRAHAFSLDHYLEFAPGGVVVRRGPIGSVAAWSRWGIGRGRGALSINGVSFNNPESGVAPWVDVATSGLGRLDFDTGARAPSWIEGSVDLVGAPPSPSRPSTYIELSKGANDVRQRRVHFGSEQGRVGIELSYDEVLDDGYAFDATGVIGDVPDFGKARSRNSAIVLRGSPDERADFTFGVRRFESTTSGDIGDRIAEGRRDGHLAWLDAAAGGARVTVYGRGFKSAGPDSQAVNETSGIALDTGVGGSEREIHVRVAVEETSFSQDVGAGSAGRLLGGNGVVSTHSRLGSLVEVFASGSAAGDDESDLVWGATAGVRRVAPRYLVSAQAGRSGRLPTLAERYLPAHDRDGRVVSGDAGVDPEHAFEVRGDWEQRTAALVNRVRVSWVTAGRHIAFRPRAVGNETWRVAANSGVSPSMLFAEERFHTEFRTGPLRTLADGSVLLSSGDRVDAFASVPELQANASLLVGGEMFGGTSALYVGAEYLHMDERADYDG